MAMFSALNSTFGVSSYFALNLHRPFHYSSKFSVQCSATPDSKASLKSKVGVNGLLSNVKDAINRNVDKVFEDEKLEPLWDDGYGAQTVKDYIDCAKDLIKPDGGPPRWFTPISCGPYLKDSPVLLFLPGVGGLGLELILHQKALGKVYDVRCMHIPVQDRTPFEELVEWIEETVRAEHSTSPSKPIYLVGDSFGGCLALAIAARNPKVDLVLILANPATSFGRSQLQLLFPVLEALPADIYVTVPYVLSLMGEQLKLATVNINAMLPLAPYLDQLAGDLTGLSPRLSVLPEILPKESLLWKLKLLKTAAGYANSRLHAVRAEVLVLASGRDNLLPSQDEARRLTKLIRNCKMRYFKDNRHSILLEEGINLLTIIKSTRTYRRSRTRDYVTDYLLPSASEYNQILSNGTLFRWFSNFAGPVMFSTTEDGSIVRGLSGVPNKGPVLLVGYHMLMGFELAPLIEQFLREKKIMVRGMAHPMFFSDSIEDPNNESSLGDLVSLYGALPASAGNLSKLFDAKCHVLLYPGGIREAFHRKGEDYKLFWPEQPEFVRMAAKYGATIVPFGAVGEDDLAELVLDYDDLTRIPLIGDQIKQYNEQYSSLIVRAGTSGEVANQPLHIPGIVPKAPGRLYYRFGKPVSMKGRNGVLKDKEKAREVYMQIKEEVNSCISYLLEKRKEDPYRNVIDRTVYRAFHAPMDNVPSFEP